MRYKLIGDTGQHLVTSQKEEKGIVLDQEILVTAQKKTKRQLSRTLRLRLITFKNPDDGRVYEFLTNNFKLSAKTIADIYKARWQVELFFKWIKQNLKIKSFVGTSRNAVMTQIWIAMCVYLLIAYLKFQSALTKSMQQILRLLQQKIRARARLSNQEEAENAASLEGATFSASSWFDKIGRAHV